MPAPIQRYETFEELMLKQPRHSMADTLSTCDVAKLLCYIEWRGYDGGGCCCPCCNAMWGSNPAHEPDCLLAWALAKAWAEHPGRLDQESLARNLKVRETK